MASVAPKLGPVVRPTIDKIEDHSVMLGQTWELKIPIRWSCPFKTTLKKDSIKLLETDRIKIASDNNVVTMSINDVNVEDTGEYEIEVANASGTATCTFKMAVCQYSFRYQYLLVEVGTSVLRKLFDSKVGQDLGSYLAANKGQNSVLQTLINGRRGGKPTLTSDQAKLLPPLENNPVSSKFDITLLTCLLRNICCLKTPADAVWTNPAQTDLSQEACITRLRHCRNYISHSGTVIFPATDFTTKWTELTDILTTLNKFCGKDGITNLQSLIDKAEDMSIDEGLTEHLKRVIKQWQDNEQDLRGDVARLESIATTSLNTQHGIKRQLDDIEHKLEVNKRPKYDFKDDLLKIYNEDCCTLKVTPLCCEDEDEVDLLTFYQPPTMCHMPYHREANLAEENYTIASYEKIFCREDDHCFRNIYITGDAGVGKTSFCQYMTLLWCKSQSGEKAGSELMQRDMDYMTRFQFVFYVSLRESDRNEIIDMIIDQLFYTKSKDNREEMYKSIETILKERECLVILDALDEWSPQTRGKKVCELPVQIRSEKCVYLTTCRPYKIENVRLSKKQLDHQVKMTGIHGQSSKRYVRAIVKHINEVNEDTRNPVEFLREVKQCGLEEQLSIPMIAAQLIVVWFDKKLTDMPRALIYSNIVDMLFERAEMRKLEFPSPLMTDVKPPDSLSELCHVKAYFPHLTETCLLAFRSLFQQDESISVFVFTEELLMREPYCISMDKINFLCKIGILSKNKVIGRFGKKEHKLSFLHKSYIEFFAALFVSSFDTSNLFDDIMNNWTTVNDVVQFQNFFLLLSGFSYQNVKRVFERVYVNISHDLALCRRNSIFHYDSDSYKEQLKSLQSLIAICFKEVCRSNDTNAALKLEDVVIDDVLNDNSTLELLVVNKTCLKSIYSVEGIYADEFDQIEHLECLNVGKASTDDPITGAVYDTRFTNCMLHNASMLHTVSIECNYTLLPALPVQNLHHLTSLALSDVILRHDSIHNLVAFLSDTKYIENIKLHDVACHDHPRGDQDDCECISILRLRNHSQLVSLCLEQVSIVCDNVNCSSLQYIDLDPLSERIFDSYLGVFDCIKNSKLEHVEIHGFYARLDYNTMSNMISTVESLQYLKSLKLSQMVIPDDVLLQIQIHPDIKETKIILYGVTMSHNCFRHFIRSLIKSESLIKAESDWCMITLGTGETYRKLERDEAVDHMAGYLESKRGVKITYERGWNLNFETTSC